MGTLKFPKLGLPWLWGPITLCVDLRLKWGPKQSCNPRWDLFNNMSHATYTQGNWLDSRLLGVEIETANLTPNLSFSHNLCFKCPNGSCEPILDMYISITFQWYKKKFNPMGFDSCNRFLKIREFIGIPTPNMGVPLGVWRFIPSHSFTLSGAWDVTPGLPSWPATLQALALVVSPRLGLRHNERWGTNKPKFSLLCVKQICSHFPP
jgi:hypothetical protein